MMGEEWREQGQTIVDCLDLLSYSYNDECKAIWSCVR